MAGDRGRSGLTLGDASPASATAVSGWDGAAHRPAAGWFGFSRLRYRLLLLVLLAVLPALALIVSTAWEQRRLAARDAHESALRLARLASTNHERLIEGARPLLIVLAQNADVQNQDARLCGAIFAGMLRQFPFYANLGAARPNGEVFCSGRPLPGPVSPVERAHFQRTVSSRDVTVSGYVIGPIGGRPLLSVAYPAINDAGTVRAVVFLSLDLAWVGPFFEKAQLARGSALAVTDRTGLVLARYPDSDAGVGKAFPGAPLVQAVEQAHGEGAAEVKGLDGIPRLFAFTALAGLPAGERAYVSVGIPTAAAFAAGEQLLMRNLAWAGFAFVLAMVLTVVMGDLVILRRMNAVVGAAKRLSAGNLGARAEVTSADEIGVMAQAFNGMADRLAESHQALTRRADEIQAVNCELAAEARERGRAEQAARHRAERLTIIHEIDRAILAAQSPPAIAEAALRQLRQLVRAPRVALALYDVATREGTVVAVDSFVQTTLAPGVSFPLEMMGDLRVLQKGEVEIVEVSRLAHLWQGRALAAEGIHSYAVMPLIARGELVGSFTFGARGPGGPPREDITVAREVADQLAVALQQGRLHGELERHAAELEARVAERTAQLAAASAETGRASAAKTEFLSRMSHELRTPLNGILGFGQLLEMEALSADQEESVAQILRAGRHLLGLINEVLDVSRIEAGRLQLSLEAVSVGETLHAALDLVRPWATDKGIALQAEAGETHRHVLADRQRLQQVLLNLLSNAVKYNRPGGAVTVACDETPDAQLRIRVTDTGHGIASDKLARLFTPFERLGADATGVEGTGLGLTLSKHLVEVMGGTLSVESEVGVGSTFSVNLPLAQAPDGAFDGSGERIAAGPEASSHGGVVLYIEDNLSNLRLVERVLARRPGTTLLSALQGQLGLDLAQEHRPDLILLDLHLPDLSGEEVLGRLREERRTRDIPVVVLSADATPTQIERLLGAGALAYLTKPLDVQALLKLLDENVPATRD
jgi:signal transduction histidine kinase/ActR/RegA family two-component response regulator/HAMP domain-containing protein